MAPKAVVNRVFSTPRFINGGQLFIQLQTAAMTNAFHQIDSIRLVHVAARAVARVEPIFLHPAKEGDRLAPLQGQHTIVFQKYRTLRSRAAEQFRHAGRYRFLRGRPSAFCL